MTKKCILDNPLAWHISREYNPHLHRGLLSYNSSTGVGYTTPWPPPRPVGAPLLSSLPDSKQRHGSERRPVRPHWTGRHGYQRIRAAGLCLPSLEFLCFPLELTIALWPAVRPILPWLARRRRWTWIVVRVVRSPFDKREEIWIGAKVGGP